MRNPPPKGPRAAAQEAQPGQRIGRSLILILDQRSKIIQNDLDKKQKDQDHRFQKIKDQDHKISPVSPV